VLLPIMTILDLANLVHFLLTAVLVLERILRAIQDGLENKVDADQ
jgi:hypothetical protein